jgi:hypothetical protein
LLLGMALISLLLISALNNTSWPVSSDISRINFNLATPRPTPPGTLVVYLISNESAFPSSGIIGNNCRINCRNYQIVPLANVPIYISLTGGLGTFATNISNVTGVVAEQLPPNSYTIRINDWRLQNLSVPLQVFSNKTTTLLVSLYNTVYVVQSYNIADPDSSGWAVGWQQVYADVPTAQIVSGAGISTFLDTQLPVRELLEGPPSSLLTPVTVSSSTVENGSEWLQLQLNNPIPIQNIQTMNLLTLRTTFAVNTSATL